MANSKVNNLWLLEFVFQSDFLELWQMEMGLSPLHSWLGLQMRLALNGLEGNSFESTIWSSTTLQTGSHGSLLQEKCPAHLLVLREGRVQTRRGMSLQVGYYEFYWDFCNNSLSIISVPYGILWTVFLLSFNELTQIENIVPLTSLLNTIPSYCLQTREAFRPRRPSVASEHQGSLLWSEWSCRWEDSQQVSTTFGYTCLIVKLQSKGSTDFGSSHRHFSHHSIHRQFGPAGTWTSQSEAAQVCRIF